MKSRSIINLMREAEKYEIVSPSWEVPFPDWFRECGLGMRLSYPGNACDSVTATPGKWVVRQWRLS